MRIGIIGGGQLARMLALAGYPLGLRFLILEPAADACAGQVAEVLAGEYDDERRLLDLAARVDIVTYDFENVPGRAARLLEQRLPVWPSSLALATAQDRLAEKTLFQDLGIPTPPFAAVESLDELYAAIGQVGLPALLKTRRFGYDGKGQRLLRTVDDLEVAWTALEKVPSVLEGFVSFRREVSMLAVRSRIGETAFYPLVENRHRDGILRLSTAPCDAPELERQAREYAASLLERLGYVGLLAIEFFDLDGRLLANEMAPRVHNSGHWTIEGAETSQFENHLRAILGWPLGSTAAVGCAAMLNFIGTLPNRSVFLTVPGVHFHDYGKEARVGRKVGHATLRADTPDLLQGRLEGLLRLC